MRKATSDLDSGVETHPHRSRLDPAKVLNYLDFADDIALLESSMARAQARLINTASAKDLGLIISVSKTEYMTANCNPQPSLEVCGDLSTMLLTSNILAPKWHQLQVTSNDARRWHGVLFRNWKDCGKVPNYLSLQKWSYSLPPLWQVFSRIQYFQDKNISKSAFVFIIKIIGIGPPGPGLSGFPNLFECNLLTLLSAVDSLLESSENSSEICHTSQQ